MSERKTMMLHEAIEEVGEQLRRILPDVVAGDSNGTVSKTMARCVIQLDSCATAARRVWEIEQAKKAAQESEAKAEGEEAGEDKANEEWEE